MSFTSIFVFVLLFKEIFNSYNILVWRAKLDVDDVAAARSIYCFVCIHITHTHTRRWRIIIIMNSQVLLLFIFSILFIVEVCCSVLFANLINIIFCCRRWNLGLWRTHHTRKDHTKLKVFEIFYGSSWLYLSLYV